MTIHVQGLINKLHTCPFTYGASSELSQNRFINFTEKFVRYHFHGKMEGGKIYVVKLDMYGKLIHYSKTFRFKFNRKNISKFKLSSKYS